VPPAVCSAITRSSSEGGSSGASPHRDEDDAVGADHGLETDANGIAGPALRLLAHRRGSTSHRGLDCIGPMADHDHRPLDADRRERVKDVEDERPAGKRVQHLRDAGAHAGALARGQDDGLGAVRMVDTLRDGRGGRFGASTDRDRRDRLDLDARALREVAHRERAPGRERLRDLARVHLVHRRPIGDVGQVDGDLHEPIEPAPGGLEDRSHVRERSVRLRLHVVADELAGGRIDAELPAVNTSSPARIAWLYGPAAAGAASVLITSRMVVMPPRRRWLRWVPDRSGSGSR
jgi:hypothetical protein